MRVCVREYVPHRHTDTATDQKQTVRDRDRGRDRDGGRDKDRDRDRQRERDKASLAAESIRTDAIIIRFAFPILLPTLATTGRIMIAAACRDRSVSICTFVLVKQVN